MNEWKRIISDRKRLMAILCIPLLCLALFFFQKCDGDFGTLLTDLIPLEYVSRAFPKLCEECGLRKLKLHELRHTNISLLLSEGASMKEVQEWAGHSNYSVTANTYAHVQAKSKSRLTESISSLLT